MEELEGKSECFEILLNIIFWEDEQFIILLWEILQVG